MPAAKGRGLEVKGRGSSAKGRGSDKLIRQLFGGSQVTKEALTKAVSAAQASGFSIVRWWWKGQPAIDQIFATLHVQPDTAGRTIEGLLDAHSSEVQVGLEVFPYGIIRPDLVQISVTMNRNLQKLSV
jgi:hypothetical protein